MDPFVDLLKEINIAQIFVILAGFWVFYNRLDRQIDKLEKRMDKFEELMTRLENDMIEVKKVLRQS